MPVPKRKTSKRRTRNRRANIRVKVASFLRKSQLMGRRSHFVDPETGEYRGKKVLRTT